MSTLVKLVSVFDEATATRSNTNYAVPSYSMPWLYTAGNYDGTVTVYFEATLSSTSGGTAAAALYTTGGSVVTGSEVTTTNTTPTRVRSGDIKANLTDATQYQVRIKSTASQTTTIYAATVIIIQTGTITKTETVIALGSSGSSTSASYVDDMNKGYWYYDSSKWDGATFYYEAFISPSNSGNTAYSQLATTGGSAVTGSEVSHTGTTTDTRYRSGSLTLTNGTTYRAEIKSSASTARARAARIVIVQSGFNVTETYYPMGNIATASTETALNNLVYYDEQEWDVYSKTVFFEAVITAPSSQTVYVDCNDGTNDDATVSSTTSSSRNRIRSSSFTPDDNTTYGAQLRTSSGTGGIYSCWIIVQATLASPNSPPTIALNTADGSQIADTTPTLEFTGSDVDGDSLRYNIQIASTSGFLADGSAIRDSYEIGGGATVHPNPTGGYTWLGDLQVDDRVGQSFTATGGVLDKIAVRFGPDVDTDGTAYIRVYTHAGTFGTSSAPLNAAAPADTPTPYWLAKSDAFTFNTGGTLDWHEFTFSGANRINLVAGEHYIFQLDWVPNDTLYDNTITTRHDSTTLSHGGNVYMDGAAEANNGPWPDLDMLFRVYEDVTLLDKLSGTDSGFANTVTGGDTDPFNAGEKISFTVQAGDALNLGQQYWWRVRVIDPSGSNTYSSWSTARTFTVSSTQTIIPSSISEEAIGSPTITTGSVSVVPSAITTAEVFGTAKVNEIVAPAAIATGEAFGTPSIARGSVSVVPSAITTLEAFGTAEVVAGGGTSEVLPTSIGSGEVFGTATIQRGSVTLTVSAIDTGEAFGTLTLQRGSVSITPSEITSAEAFGTAKVSLTIAPSGISSGEAFGTAKITLTISPTSIASDEAFGTATITRGSVTLVPSAIPSEEAFGTITVTRGSVSLVVSGITSTEAFGNPTVTVGSATVSPAGIASGEAFGTSVVTGGAAAIFPSGIPSEEAFGTITIARGSVSVVASGISSAEAFGTSVITRGSVSVIVSGIAPAEAFGNATVAGGATTVSPSGIVGAEAFGNPTLTRGSVTITVPSITSAEEFGSPVVSRNAVILSPTGIASAEAFGSPTVIPQPVTLTISGIASGETFGTLVITSGFVISVNPVLSSEAFGTPAISRNILVTSIPSANAFGTLKITLSVAPSGISTAEAFGTPRLAQRVAPAGISTGAEFGTPAIAGGAVTITVSPIASQEAFGVAAILRGAVIITPASIASSVAFGTPALRITLSPVSISSGEVFGTAVLQRVIAPIGIPSGMQFGTPWTSGAGVVFVIVPSLPSDEAFGIPRVFLKTDVTISWDVFVTQRISERSVMVTTFSKNVCVIREVRRE